MEKAPIFILRGEGSGEAPDSPFLEKAPTIDPQKSEPIMPPRGEGSKEAPDSPFLEKD